MGFRDRPHLRGVLRVRNGSRTPLRPGVRGTADGNRVMEDSAEIERRQQQSHQERRHQRQLDDGAPSVPPKTALVTTNDTDVEWAEHSSPPQSTILTVLT